MPAGNGVWQQAMAPYGRQQRMLYAASANVTMHGGEEIVAYYYTNQ